MFAAASHAWERWSHVREQNGLRSACEWLGERIGSKVLNLGVAEVIWLDADKVLLQGEPPAGFEYRFLTPDDVQRFVSPENELNESHVTRIAAGHDLCFAAIQGERLAAFGWYALDCIEGEHCDSVALSFPQNVSYMYKGFTHPDFRGQRLHGYIMRMALEQLARERGITALVSTVSFVNWPSLKSCDRLGYERLGRLIRMGWGWLSTCFSPRAAKQRGVRFGRHADLSARKSPRSA